MNTPIPSWVRYLWQPLGEWRTQLIFRSYGLSLLLMLLFDYHGAYLNLRGAEAMPFFTLAPDVIEFFWGRNLAAATLLGLSGLLMLFLGPRIFTLALSSVFSVAALTHVISTPLAFPTANWPWRAFLPLIALCLALASRTVSSRQYDEAVVKFVRYAFTIVIFFVTFHKYNSDHFVPELSCGGEIIGFFQGAWGAFGELLAGATPVYMGLAVEAIMFIAIFLAPRTAIAITAGLLSIFALSGATGVTSLVIACSLALLRHDHLEALQKYWRPMLYTFGTIFTLIFGISLIIYKARVLSTQEIFLLEAILVGTITLAAFLVWHDAKMAGRNIFSYACWHPESLFRIRDMHAATKRIIIVAVVVSLVNCLSPYLGFKFHLSLSMWSNLRADSYRWNHYIVPQWVQLVDPIQHYVDVTHIELRPYTVQHTNLEIHNRTELQTLLNPISSASVNLNIHFTANGRTHRFTDAWSNHTFRAELNNLMKDWHDETSVHIHKIFAQLHPERWPNPKKEFSLEPALFEAGTFKILMQHAYAQPFDMDISFRYRDQDYTFVNATSDQRLHNTVDPYVARPLLQNKLTTGEPQWCIH